MRCPRLRRRLEGFSLLEVLAAFVILALVATALFQLFSGALGNAAAAEAYSRAVLVAESRLAAAAAARPLLEVVERGDDDDGRIQWEARVKAWEPPNVDPELARVSEGMITRLYRVEVDVRFPGLAGRERTLTLATVKLAAKDPPK
jgi:general secretion pathway protein I